LRLTIYGRSVVIKILIITLAIDIIAILIPIPVIKLILLVVSVGLISFTLYFFRDPMRHIPEGLKDNQVLSPGDGKVMLIEEINENDFLKSKAKLVGIFLSPFNVHVNRIPVSGKIDLLQHINGKYIAAYNPDSTMMNERTLIGISNPKFKVLIKQVAGYVARRIVCELRTGDNVTIGEKFGMIKFGSRVDVIVPENSKIKVSVNQKVVGGLTILAEVPV